MAQAAPQSDFDVMGVLENVPLLSGLNNNQKQTLARQLTQETFSKDEPLMVEGEEGDKFYIIVSGRVDVHSNKAGHLAFLGQADYAGEQALLKSTVRNATLTAVEDTVCLVCDKRTFENIKSSVKFAKREGKKRRAFYTAINQDEKLPEVEEKPQQTVEWILECVSDNLLFLKLDRNQRERVVSRMKLIDVARGEALITQGDKNAQTFYVTEQGAFDILVDNVKVGEYKRGGCFGELALLYDSPRAATILATANSKVWEVSRNVFRNEVAQTYKQKANDNIAFLKQVELFKPLLSQELSLVSDALEEKNYAAGEIVINEGDEGDKFYVIKKGTAKWSKKNGESGLLKEKLFFGERALRTKQRRAATISAKTDITLLEMTAKDFEALLGPVIQFVDDQINQYKRQTELFESKQQGNNPNDTNGTTDDAKAGDNNNNTDNGDESSLEALRDQVCDLLELVTIGVLGKGAFGLVSLVEDPNSHKSYALKAIKKHQIVELGQQAHIISEKRVMEKMHNKFLVNLHRTYKDRLRVYFLLDACLGGELFTILRQRRYFDEPTAKFFTACVVEAFAYMHSKLIIYRDLKPENLVLDSDGYLKVTDFGFAKEVADKTFTLCGTPDYLAPEIVTGQGHGSAVDWWTLGVLIYEMLASFPPFFDDEPIETYRKIIRGRVKFPRYFSAEARDLIRGLLRNKPTKRLGILKGGADNIRKHGWFYGFDWNKLRQGKIKAPIQNRVRNHKDLSNFVNNDDDEDDDEALPVSDADDFGKEF